VTQTANAWMEEIGSQRVAVGYTSTVDLDTAMSTRAAKASAFLKRFRGTIRANTIAKLLVNYSGDCEWNLPQRVNFNHFVVEPVVSECVYNAHCGLLHIPATFEDVLYRLSEEDRLMLYDAWKETRKCSIGVLNCMLKAYYLVGYCVFRRLQTVCNSHRSHKLASCAHEVSGKFILYYTILYITISYHTMLYYTILYYTIPYYTLLYHIIPCHTIPYYTILYHSIPYYTILYHAIPYLTILYYTILYHTVLYYTILYDTTLYDTIPYHSILYYTIPYQTTLFYTVLYHGILYYTISYYTIVYYITLYHIISYETVLYHIIP